ncbi:MAG: 16S rRNA (guanine(527)-N(7))-methyltransferase RsmG [Spirochaetales bacterium]|nr:16S rRNA (guanine(527)-N(7))-methyltransferase RsmG [Spirochaetales bacterium]
MTQNPAVLLKQGLIQLGLPHDEKHIAMIETYLDEIEKWNKRHDMVKADREQLVTHHVLDSLAGIDVIKSIPSRERILDIGSGAGFPGIPLALCLPDSHITLSDRSTIRTAFLSAATIRLGITNCEVICGDYREIRGHFDVITFRAFSETGKELYGMERLLAVDGTIIAYKGREEKILKELTKIDSVKWSHRVIRVKVPFLEKERHLLMLSRKGSPAGSV